MTTPIYSSGTSIINSSYGSCRSPFSPVRVMTRGRETWNSYPSRRIVSIRMPRCSSPRPETLWVSGLSVGSTRSATLRSSSLKSRSRNWRLVTYLPSRPAKGPLFTMKSTEIVGSSTAMPWQALRRVDGREGLADFDGLEPGQRHDVARARFLHLDPMQAVEREQLGDAAILGRLVGHHALFAHRQERHLVAHPHAATLDPPDGDAAEEGREVEGGDQHLERPLRITARCAARGPARPGTAASGRYPDDRARESPCRLGSRYTGTAHRAARAWPRGR